MLSVPPPYLVLKRVMTLPLTVIPLQNVLKLTVPLLAESVTTKTPVELGK